MKLRTGVILRELFKRCPGINPLTDNDLTKLKEEMASIANDFIKVCQKYNLKYYLSYGTTLGAVRHKGFIPWDDDLDICMPREDYDRFLKIWESEMGDKYFVRCVCQGDKVDIPTMHLRKKGTKYVNFADFVNMYSEPEEMRGIYIDIAPIENAPDNKIIRKLDAYFCMFVMFLISCISIKKSIKVLQSQGVLISKSERNSLRIKECIGIICGIVPVYKWWRFYNWYASKNKNKKSKYVTEYTGMKNINKSTYERNKIFPTQEGSFERHIWQIPNDTDYYLSLLYRDYMTIPPKDQQLVHPVFELNFDTNK